MREIKADNRYTKHACGNGYGHGNLLSIRGVDRTLRVAWSLADLAGRELPGLDEVAAALSFRQLGVRR